MPRSDDISQMLDQLDQGDQAVIDQLLPLVYDELRRLAHYHLRHERDNHTINTTALVHEAYLKLLGPAPQRAWNNRAHFIAVASRAMRQILVDYARGRGRLKRGGDAVRVSLEKAGDLADADIEELLTLEDALARLEAVNAQHARIVECRYFGGLSLEETATALGMSLSSVKRGWRAARAWLYRALEGPGTAPRGAGTDPSS